MGPPRFDGRLVDAQHPHLADEVPNQRLHPTAARYVSARG
jgi:hypothetical protein